MSPDPGQVISPQGNSPEQPQDTPPKQEGVETSISHEPKLPEPQGDIVTPQPAVPEPQPAPQPNSLPAEQPQAYGSVPEPQPQPQQPAPQPANTYQAPPAQFQQAAVSHEQQFVSPDELDQEQYDEDTISWTASEYIAHHKPSSWFVMLGIAAVVVTALVYALTDGDLISTIAIPLIAFVFGMYAHRQPREQRYALSNNGVTIGERTYGFGELRSFAIIDEGPFSSIVFVPMKRFAPMLSIYYDPKDEELIAEFLAARLPMDQRGHDAIDRLMKKIRF